MCWTASTTSRLPSHPCHSLLSQAYLGRDADRPKQAKDFQYPSWQRLQWANWGELQLSGEAKRRLAAAVLACGILLVLALKLIATKAAHSVLDESADSSDKRVLHHRSCSSK